MNEATKSFLPAELLVCIKCRKGQPVPSGAPAPGTRLFDNLSKTGLPEGVTLTPVECLQNCERGCSVAMRGSGRWTYVYGHLHEETDVAMLLDGVRHYHATADGLIPWRQRPDHFKKNCIARIPPMESSDA